LNLRLNVTSETTASRSFYSDLSYSKAIAELRGAKYCISTFGGWGPIARVGGLKFGIINTVELGSDRSGT
jgi:hypothetical protein